MSNGDDRRRESPAGAGIGMIFKRRTTMVLSALAAALGLVAVIVRLAAGDGLLASGVVVGAMLFVVGGMRLWLAYHGATPPSEPRKGEGP